MDNTDIIEQNENMYNFIYSFFSNPTIVIILFIVIMIFIGISISLGNKEITNETNPQPQNLNIIGLLVFTIFLILIIVNGLQYFLDIDISAFAYNLFTPKRQLDVKVYNDDKETKEDIIIEYDYPSYELSPQVFNIPENKYTFEDANALCKAYGADLASYEQVEDSYNHGGEWCNYGWSKGQQVFFPTQKTTFDKLQQIKGHEHDCGRIGINGGYIANPKVRFGVNCYGIKPTINKDEELLMDTLTEYPLTQKDIDFQKKVDYWKKNINDIIISPFNKYNWYKI